MIHRSDPQGGDRPNLVGSLPFIGVHLAALMVFFVEFSWIAAAVGVLLYVVRMFGITAGYHRYFSHRSFSASRLVQFLFGVLGASSAQMGPLWWAAHHRHHHRHSDTEEDVHSPGLRGLWWAHVGWIVCDRYVATRYDEVKDLARYPELRLLDRFHVIVPTALASAMFTGGWYLAWYVPSLNLNGTQLLAYGFFLSTVFLYHGTFCINSLAHIIGRRRFKTSDESKNSLFLAIITLGEGWHNNHHRYPASERQGFYWWEWDPTHYALTVLSWFGIVRDLKAPPRAIYEEAESIAA